MTKAQSRIKKASLLPDWFKYWEAANSDYQFNNTEGYAEAARLAHGINPATDNAEVILMEIDAQKDFSFPDGSLYVAGRDGLGAINANLRLAMFSYSYPHLADRFLVSRDTHNNGRPTQIFFANAHLRRDGSEPESNTQITADEYERGDYQPNPLFAESIGADTEWLRRHMIHYCRQLEAQGKYKLWLWPAHCIDGTKGHQLAPLVDQAWQIHRLSHQVTEPTDFSKGAFPLTEFYSIFSPEVRVSWDGTIIAERNDELIDRLLSVKVLILAGLASSHCFRASVDDLKEEIKKRNPALARKIYILKDCIAPVVIPGVMDFTDIANQALESYKDFGMQVVQSTDPLESWPGLMDNLA